MRKVCAQLLFTAKVLSAFALVLKKSVDLDGMFDYQKKIEKGKGL